MEYMKLSNGVEMPVLGIGTYTISPEDAERSVKEALRGRSKHSELTEKKCLCPQNFGSVSIKTETV